MKKGLVMSVSLRCLLATTILSSALASPAFAQVSAAPGADQTAPIGTPVEAATDAGANAQADIVVTGSRIARRNLDSAAPVAVVSDKEFALSGTVNAEQVINTLPQVIPGSTGFDNNPGGGVATLNLRGLGTNRSLVLVNGRRWMFFDTTQVVDLNTIPTFLIQSVDVVTGGASAVYGSDAVAGVVNFRLRDDLVGAEVGAQYNISGRGDGRRYDANLALGTDIADGKGHITIFGEYFKRSSIFQGDRPFSAATQGENATATALVPGGSSTTPFGRFTSTYAAAACPAGNIFCSPGAYYASPGNSRPRLPTDLYNFGAVNYLQVPQERYLIGGYGNYEFGGGHEAYAEVAYVNNRVANELAATPVTGTFQVRIDSIAPFISASDVAALRQLDTIAATGNTVGDGIVPLAVQRRVVETGSRNSLDDRNAFRILTGLRGPITDTIHYDAYYSYARTRNSNIQAGNISRSAFQAGLNGTAAPINIFGPGTLTRAMVDQITITAQNTDISALQVASASVSGNLFNLGLGGDDVGFAFGGEYRKVSSQFIPDTALSSGDVIGFNAGTPTKGGYDVKEAFGELRIPIAANAPFISRAEINLAGRYSDYGLSAVGGVWTYAAGAEYAPIRDITFRGQYQRAVRAPNVAELFGGAATGFFAAQDPCAQATAATNPTIRALCIATGVPAGSVGSASLQINTQIQGTVGGNANLQQETSDSFTAGVVLRPSIVPGLAITADYFNVKIKNAIGVFGGGLPNALNLCYNVIQQASSPYCQVFAGTRNALGQFDGVNAPLFLNANTGTFATEGVDAQIDYSTRLPFALLADSDARLSFFFLGTWTPKTNTTPVQDRPDIQTKCAGKFGIKACGEPSPEYKWTSRLSYLDGPMTTSLRWRHVSAVSDDDPATTYFVERIPAHDLFDLSFAFDINKLNISLGVNNIFDKLPKVLGNNQAQANTYPNTYDPLGRDFFVSARIKF